ncbi:hypothetical protein BJY00DRAFT_26477 [Aspergillus carlsbadensis]|nr:hypothetical protein BJY00DRAFT_26477 [Aspergillus carlsbadensis]
MEVTIGSRIRGSFLNQTPPKKTSLFIIILAELGKTLVKPTRYFSSSVQNSPSNNRSLADFVLVHVAQLGKVCFALALNVVWASLD